MTEIFENNIFINLCKITVKPVLKIPGKFETLKFM